MTHNPFVEGLNDRQKEAVEVLSGPLLILAGAGSGKTKCLTHRIANLMAHGTDGGEILAVTFTNKAAKEMKERLERMLSSSSLAAAGYRMPHVGTFHSTCVRILRRELHHLHSNYTRDFVIFDTADQRSLMTRLIKDLNLDPKVIKARPVLSHISSAKNQLLGPDGYAKQAESTPFTQAVTKLYRRYIDELESQNGFDFDDLLGFTVKLFEECPHVLEKYRTQWQHVMIDEYQDTNFAQYRLVRLLVDQHQNICVIGDDSQSIYRFRGADYTNILNFEQDFPGAKVMKLEQNYRSTGHILQCANALIDKNKTGRKKRLWTAGDKGDKVKVVQVGNEREEGDLLAQALKEYTREGGTLSDCAILYRMNAQSRAIEEALMRAQVPYTIVGGTRFFDRAEIKDLLAYLRLILNSRDDTAFGRIINIPKRQLGPKTLETVYGYAKNYSLSALEVLEHVDEIGELPAKKQATLKAFWQMIRTLREEAERGIPLSLLLSHVIERTKYKTHLDDGSLEGKSRMQNVEELFSVAGRYDTAEDSLAAFLEGVALISDVDQYDDQTDHVTLMTLHSSKGLEWPAVFLPGWEEGVFPGKSAFLDPESMEEERRLAYVGITRAKQHCTLTHARRRMLFGQTQYSSPSPFLGELAPDAVEGHNLAAAYEPARGRHSARDTHSFGSSIPASKNTLGQENTTDYETSDRVKHPKWGVGTVIMIQGDVLTIAFAGQGMKKLVASVAPLTKV